MPDEYIKRSDAILRVANVPIGNWSSARYVNEIMAIPAADVEGKRLTGVWLEQPEKPNVRGNNIYRCSICGYGDEHSPSAEVPYCWHCGSKMKREVK